MTGLCRSTESTDQNALLERESSAEAGILVKPIHGRCRYTSLNCMQDFLILIPEAGGLMSRRHRFPLKGIVERRNFVLEFSPQRGSLG